MYHSYHRALVKEVVLGGKQEGAYASLYSMRLCYVPLYHRDWEERDVMRKIENARLHVEPVA